ncbi:hypothetical protein ACI65C_010173 [Semiaphis heraclei]
MVALPLHVGVLTNSSECLRCSLCLTTDPGPPRLSGRHKRAFGLRGLMDIDAHNSDDSSRCTMYQIEMSPSRSVITNNSRSHVGSDTRVSALKM